jgi:hypothetical protein
LKKRLFAEGLKERKCECCGQGEIWQGRKMSLILDHVNGVGNDHRLENLRIVCPNCAATFETHCGRNLPRERSCAHCGKPFAPRVLHQRHCSFDCGSRWDRWLLAGPGGKGIPRRESRKVERPAYDQLMRDIGDMSYLAIGRKYGVSDNAVRKWLRFYERERERHRQVESSSDQ